MKVDRACPDWGTCHHECADDAVCFRVKCCGPLTNKRENDEWVRSPEGSAVDVLRALWEIDSNWPGSTPDELLKRWEEIAT